MNKIPTVDPSAPVCPACGEPGTPLYYWASLWLTGPIVQFAECQQCGFANELTGDL